MLACAPGERHDIGLLALGVMLQADGWLVAYLGGWGRIAIPGPQGIGVVTVYILAPILGAFLGGWLYTRVLRPSLPADTEKEEVAA